MNIYKFYGLIGPWATPAPAAIALAGRLYGEWATTDKLTGWGVAIFSLAALEVAGGLCSYQMIQASLSRRWGWFWACLFGVIAYLALGVYALWGVTAWIYVVLAVFVHISVAADLTSGQHRHEYVEDKTLDLAFEKEKTRQAQAKAREAKAGQLIYPKALRVDSTRRSVDGGEEIKPCVCGATFTRSQDKAIHARRCEAASASRKAGKAAKLNSGREH